MFLGTSSFDVKAGLLLGQVMDDIFTSEGTWGRWRRATCERKKDKINWSSSLSLGHPTTASLYWKYFKFRSSNIRDSVHTDVQNGSWLLMPTSIDCFCLYRTRLEVKWRHLVVTLSVEEFSSIFYFNAVN